MNFEYLEPEEKICPKCNNLGLEGVENGEVCLNCASVYHEGCYRCGTNNMKFLYWRINGKRKPAPYYVEYDEFAYTDDSTVWYFICNDCNREINMFIG